MPSVPSGPSAPTGPKFDQFGDKTSFGGAGEVFSDKPERFDKPDSQVIINGTGTKLSFDFGGNFFGGKGMANKGEVSFKAGKSEFTGKYEGTAGSFLNVSKGASLDFQGAAGVTRVGTRSVGRA